MNRIGLSILTIFLCNLLVTNVDAAKLTATWIDNTEATAITHIERRLSTELSFERIATVAPGIVIYEDLSVLADFSYCYRLQAERDSQFSPYSSEACATPAVEVPPLTITMNITEGALLSGTVDWHALPSVAPMRVEFLINSTLAWTENQAPYEFNGAPNAFDTKTLLNGTHVLVARAIYTDTMVAATANVQVMNEVVPPPPPADVTPPTIVFGTPILIDRNKKRLPITVSDPGLVVLVEVRVNGSLVSSTTTGVVTFDATTVLSRGQMNHGALVHVTARDTFGNIGTAQTTVFR